VIQDKLLKFSKANAKLVRLEKKLGKKIYSFSVLSGWTCPGAKDCLSKAIETKDGFKIKDGPHTEFRCFSASQEALYPEVYKQRKHNADLMKGKTTEELTILMIKSLPKRADIIRLYVGGDIANLNVLKAWINVAIQKPQIVFYGYTKSLNYLVSCLKEIPQNLKFTASRGGRYDHLIEEYDLKNAKVVYSTYEAKKLKLPIDVDDSHCLKKGNFSLLIHAAQPKGSKASIAWQRVKYTHGGYSDKKNKELGIT
jgi:hypothetical protein